MDYRQFLSGLYANAHAESGNNTISNDSDMYMDPDVAKNKMKKSNINVNIVVPDTTVNDVNSQAQAQAQVQSSGGQCAPPKKVTIPIYKKEDVYKKAIQIREIEVKCGTKDVQVGEKVACINDCGLEVSCEPTVTKDVKYVPVESTKVNHDVIGGKVPCRIDLPPGDCKPKPEPKPTKPCLKPINNKPPHYYQPSPKPTQPTTRPINMPVQPVAKPGSNLSIGNTLDVVDGQVVDGQGNVVGVAKLDKNGNFVGIEFN